jgi:predicted RNA-binding Zn ribbon-like protein
MSTTASRAILRFDDGGWAEAIGGHPALDLVNTVAWRLDPARTVDRVVDGAALVHWAEFAGVIDAGRARAFGRENADVVVPEVRRLREQVHRVLQPLAVGSEPEAKDVATLHRSLVGALARAQTRATMPLDLATGLATVGDLPDELALHAWRLLEREDRSRLRQCQAEDCGWLFLDRTKNGSRVWCSSADCGNRTRARRHYARRTTEPR